MSDLQSKRILVAVSGGVDSAAVCVLLKAGGWEPIGLTLAMHAETDPVSREAVRNLVEVLGIEHHYLDCRERFLKDVIIPSAGESVAGRTPNPCCRCNPMVKFAAISEFADAHGIKHLATGHYVGTAVIGGRRYLTCGTDKNKDQSYFLYRLSSELLDRMIFPLSELDKTEVRHLVEQAGLTVAKRPDSQDICFANASECCGETLLRLSGLKSKTGFFSYDGKRLAAHKGVCCYTLGQRKGLNIALGRPAYVRKIDAVSGDIELVTDERKLFSWRFKVNEAVWHHPVKPEDFSDLQVKIRFRSPGVACRVFPAVSGEWEVVPETPLRAVTPGQSAVFYWQNILLGGGVIGRVDYVD